VLQGRLDAALAGATSIADFAGSRGVKPGIRKAVEAMLGRAAEAISVSDVADRPNVSWRNSRPNSRLRGSARGGLRSAAGKRSVLIFPPDFRRGAGAERNQSNASGARRSERMLHRRRSWSVSDLESQPQLRISRRGDAQGDLVDRRGLIYGGITARRKLRNAGATRNRFAGNRESALPTNRRRTTTRRP